MSNMLHVQDLETKIMKGMWKKRGMRNLDFPYFHVHFIKRLGRQHLVIKLSQTGIIYL